MNEILGLKNINMLSKDIYNKLEDPATDELWAVETETYSDDDGNWYRVYPDGWCEQGGRIYNNADVANTINLFKEMRDTKYTCLLSHGVNGYYGTTVAGRHLEEPYNFTTTSFTAWTYNSNGLNYIQWRVSGYIA